MGLFRHEYSAPGCQHADARVHSSPVHPTTPSQGTPVNGSPTATRPTLTIGRQCPSSSDLGEDIFPVICLSCATPSNDFPCLAPVYGVVWPSFIRTARSLRIVHNPTNQAAPTQPNESPLDLGMDRCRATSPPSPHRNALYWAEIPSHHQLSPAVLSPNYTSALTWPLPEHPRWVNTASRPPRRGDLNVGACLGIPALYALPHGHSLSGTRVSPGSAIHAQGGEGS